MPPFRETVTVTLARSNAIPLVMGSHAHAGAVSEIGSSKRSFQPEGCDTGSTRRTYMLFTASDSDS